MLTNKYGASYTEILLGFDQKPLGRKSQLSRLTDERRGVVEPDYSLFVRVVRRTRDYELGVFDDPERRVGYFDDNRLQTFSGQYEMIQLIRVHLM